MKNEDKVRVENFYQSKDEGILAERFKLKIVQLFCGNSDQSGIRYIVKRKYL